MTARRSARRSLATPASARVAAHPCEEFKPLYDRYENVKLGKEIVTAKTLASATVKVSAEVLKILTVGMLNYTQLQQLIEVAHADPFGFSEVATTHYGRSSHTGGATGGTTLSYGIHVTMPAVPEMLAKCGYLSGVDVKFPDQDPKTGVITGAPISWEDQPGDRLAICYGANGATSRDPVVPIDEHGRRYAYPNTDDKGDAFFELVPNNELIMGVGTRCDAMGHVRATVKVDEIAEMPGTRAFWDAMPFKSVSFRYLIGYHRARGYRFRAVPTFNWTRTNYGEEGDSAVVNTGTGVEEWAGRICGPTVRPPDAAAQPISWQISGMLTSPLAPWERELIASTKFAADLALPDGQTVIVNTDLSKGPPITMQRQTGDQPTVLVARGAVPETPSPAISYITYKDTPTNSPVSPPITEDTTCPTTP